MPAAGFVHAVGTNERPQNNAVDRAVTGIGTKTELLDEKKKTYPTAILCTTNSI